MRLLVYSVLPLDLTISAADLVRKYRAGTIQLIPFSDLRLSIGWLYGLLRDTAVFIPVGMLTATLWADCLPLPYHRCRCTGPSVGFCRPV